VPREGDLTSDEPYEPSFDAEDVAEIHAAAGVRRGKPMRERIEEKPAWSQPRGHKSGTMMAPLSPAMQARFDEIKKKMDLGEELTAADNEYLIHRTAIELLESKRPSIRMGALRALQHSQLKKLVAQGLVNAATGKPAEVDPAAGLGLSSWKG
jgi:hypothetical protein